jgi:hypothetical protein
VRIECYEIEWRIGTLEDQIQSWRLILEHSLHETCLARSTQSIQAPDAVACAVLSAEPCSVRCLSAFRSNDNSAEDSGRYSSSGRYG